MSIMYGYGCITTSKTKNSIETDIENTKAYKNLRDKFKENFFDTDHLIVDVLNGNNLKRSKLLNLLDTIQYDDIIFVLNLNSLGKNSNEVLKLYNIIIERDINLLIPDYTNKETGISKFSTCDFGGNKVHTKQELFVIADELKNIKIKDNRGKYAKPMTAEFIKAYWEYENYFIKEETAFKEAGGITKTVFYKWATEYEKGLSHTFNYNEALEEQDQLYRIGIKPKRHGKKPEWFDELARMVERQNMTIKQASDKLGVLELHEIDYRRYKLKTGRKSMAQALYDYCKEDMKPRN